MTQSVNELMSDQGVCRTALAILSLLMTGLKIEPVKYHHICHISNVKCHVSYFKCLMSHVTCHVAHLLNFFFFFSLD